MSRYLKMALAHVLIWTAAGCSLDAFLSPAAVVYGPKTVAAGSVSFVCAQLQDGLGDAGVLMQMKRAGSEVRLAGITPAGKVVCLHLDAKSEGSRKMTLVRMQWDRGGDEEFWQLVLKILATPATGSDDTPSAGKLAIPSGMDAK